MTNWKNGRPDDWIGWGGFIPEAGMNRIYRPEYLNEKIKEGQLYEAGASAMLSVVLVYLNEPCPHQYKPLSFSTTTCKRECHQCMAELKEVSKCKEKNADRNLFMILQDWLQ